MSSLNSTVYYSADESSPLKDLIMDSTAAEQLPYVDNTESQTPKRQVRIRKHNIFANDTEEYSICRRQSMPASTLDLSPSTRNMRKEIENYELLRLRRERWTAERKKPERRYAMRI